MSRNNPWVIVFVVLIICWSFFEMYPPTSRDLAQEFASRAMNRDANIFVWNTPFAAELTKRVPGAWSVKV